MTSRKWRLPGRLFLNNTSTPPVLGFPFCAYTLWWRMIKFDVSTHMGRAPTCSSPPPPASPFLPPRPPPPSPPRTASPHPKGVEPQRSPVLGFPSIYAYIIWCRSTKFDMLTHMGRFLFLGVSHVCNQRQRSPALSNFGGSLYFCLHRMMQNNQIWRDKHIQGSCLFLGCQPGSCPKGQIPCTPLLWKFPLFMLTPLTKNDQIRRGNTFGSGVFLGFSHTIAYCTRALHSTSSIVEFLVLQQFAFQTVVKFFCKCIPVFCCCIWCIIVMCNDIMLIYW